MNQREYFPINDGNEEKTVCISYKRENSKRVFEGCIFPLIDDYGVRFYWDKAFADNASVPWSSQMLEHISQAGVCILFVSPEYLTSHACFLEVVYAVSEKKKIIVIDMDAEPGFNPDAEEYKKEIEIKDSTLSEFQLLYSVCRQPNKIQSFPTETLRMINEISSNGKVKPETLAKRFKKFVSNLAVTRLSYKSKEKAPFSSIKTSLENISKGFFDPGLKLIKSEELVTQSVTAVTPEPISAKPDIKPEIKSDVNNEETKASEPDSIISALVRTTLRQYLEEGKVSAEEIEALCEAEYSKKVLHLNFPLLVKKGSEYNHRRYYADPVNINGVEYMICSQWYETLANNDRPYLEKWIKDHENGPITISMENVVLVGEDTGKKTKSPSVNCAYTIYGKYYPDDSQAIMMINVFAKVLNKHTDLIPQLIPLLNCLSDENFEDNKPANMPSYFRVCKYFPIGSGVCVGAAYSLLDKLKLIARLLVYCKEPVSIFTIEDTEIQADFIKWYEKYKANSEKGGSEGGELKPVHKAGDLTYTIYGKEYTGNQTNMMVDAINAIIVKHFDKLQEIVKQLTSVELGEISTLKAKGITYFRTGESFTYQGITYSIGTSYNKDAKLGQIEKAIKICNEDPENFDLEGLEIKEDHKLNTGSAKRAFVKQRDFLND